MKITKKTCLASILLSASALLFNGCATTEASYVDPTGPDTVISTNQINIQDWNYAADSLVSDLLASNVLDRAPKQPVVMAISRIKNDTQVMVDTDSLVKKIRIALNRTGKVVTTTIIGYGKNVEDPLAADEAAIATFMSDEPKKQSNRPYYTLSGKLLQDVAKAGNKKQVSYTFQLSLTTVENGIAVWEGEEIISKQRSKSALTVW